MILSLLQTLPAEVSAETDAALSVTWRLLDQPAAWVLVLFVIPAAATLAAVAYRKEPLPRGPRWVLASLRFVSLALLIVVLCRPVEVRQQENVQQAEVAVLIDDSASMRRLDSYSGDTAAGDAVNALTGRAAGEVTRLELAAAALEGTLLPHLEQNGYLPRLFAFDQSAARITALSTVEGSGHGTHLGDALARALSLQQGRHLSALVVVSDGRSNGGQDPLEAAAAVRAAGVPIHTLVVGDTRPERNLLVELVEAPPSVLEGDQVVIGVRVHSRGTADVGTVQVLLDELPPIGSGEEPRTVATEEVRVTDVGERVVLVAPHAPATDRRSERRFRVSVPPLPDERMTDDNRIELVVHVSRDEIRVLYVEGYPRYEYRFLKDLLLRADARIESQVYLMSATPDFPQEASVDMPRLRRVPTARRELLDNYDVVLLGDVNPYSISPDPERGEEFVRSLFEFVERGGGLGVIAGEYENPKALTGTEFAELLPVELDPTSSLPFDLATEVERRPLLESPANPHEVVRLEADLEQNRELWEERSGMRGYYWHFPGLRAKPGAQVLLRHPERSLTGEDEHDPLLVVGYYPSGRTLFLASDDMSWRWRYRYVHRYHERFWRNAIRWLALGRLKGGDRRYSLEPLRTRYGLDQRVTLEARVLDEDYQPLDAAEQEAWLQGPDAAPRVLKLGGVEGRAGLFRGTFQAERPGLYRAWIEVDSEQVAATEVEVVLPSRENANPSPDPATLRDVSRLTKGVHLPVTAVAELCAAFPGGEERRQPVSSQLEDAWDHWGTLLAALAILSLEWILRKRYELV